MDRVLLTIIFSCAVLWIILSAIASFALLEWTHVTGSALGRAIFGFFVVLIAVVALRDEV